MVSNVVFRILSPKVGVRQDDVGSLHSGILQKAEIISSFQCLWKEGSHHVMTTWANFLLDWFEDNPSWNHPKAYDIATSESPMGREFQDLHFYEFPRVV